MKEIYLGRLNKLFPNNALKKIYAQINQDFAIDYPPRLSFNVSGLKTGASGYNFKDNSINLSLCDLLDRNYKIVKKTQTGEKTVVSSFTRFPVFLSKEEARQYIDLNLNSRSCFAKPISKAEQRKFILQKIAREVIKAQQYMMIRQVDKIGDVGIIQAGIHSKTIQKANQAQACARYLLSGTFWDKHKSSQEISLDTSIGRQALVWLDSIENPHSMSRMEMDANERSYNYIRAKFGEY